MATLSPLACPVRDSVGERGRALSKRRQAILKRQGCVEEEGTICKDLATIHAYSRITSLSFRNWWMIFPEVMA